MKVVSIVGARPQFIKAAPVTRILRQQHNEILVHTGQHYDDRMSAVFFRDMQIPDPDYNLQVGSGHHGWQTGQMLMRIEEILLTEKPDWVLVYGDTNSTLAGALAAIKLKLRLAHVEAGLRSFNRKMPEEHNRVLTDHCSDLLFCPTQTAVENLSREGVINGVHLVGDTMYDTILEFAEIAQQRSTIIGHLGLIPKGYLLATVHRPSNTDDPDNLNKILAAFHEIGEPIVCPVHPRTRLRIDEAYRQESRRVGSNVRMIDPVGYLDMLALEQNARIILTDSGGVQKEAYWLGVPCITLRNETEWEETVDAGWNLVVGADPTKIAEAIRIFNKSTPDERLFKADGMASARIVRILTT